MAAPEPAQGVAVAVGVEWVRMPLPIDLNHINVWLIEDRDGFVVVDTGMSAELCKEAWQTLERHYLARKPLTQVFVTHVHPDHIGLAAWLQERHRVPVLMSERTHTNLRALYGAGASRAAEVQNLLRVNGVPETTVQQPTFKPERFGRLTSGVPEVEHFVTDEERLPWCEGAWRALRTDGHAEGHLCLWNQEQQLLISGDQVLPTISPNISLTFGQADTNPLGSYLTSLARLRELPERTLTLPSHGSVFYGLHDRIDDLRGHHERHLDQLVAACDVPKTAYELLSVMFRRVLAGMHLFLAMGEAIAHLEYLVQANRLERMPENGVIRYVARGQ